MTTKEVINRLKSRMWKDSDCAAPQTEQSDWLKTLYANRQSFNADLQAAIDRLVYIAGCNEDLRIRNEKLIARIEELTWPHIDRGD